MDGVSPTSGIARWHAGVAWCALAGLLLSSGRLSAQLDTPGLYAEIETNKGTFIADLEFEKASQTVANFVSLAEGSRSWVAPLTGAVSRRPFYEGISFHRVISGFVIQAGSPSGTGGDGPGYTFQDEFDGGLRHAEAYVLSMANSGPNSNGSQFFITLAATPFLDGKHSVFGRITAGKDIVDTIGAVDVDEDDKPKSPVIIQRTTIHRIGEAAEAFSVDAHGLPEVRGVQPHVLHESDRYVLSFYQQDNADYLAFQSGDLQIWEGTRFRLYTESPVIQTQFELTEDLMASPRMFYRIVEIRYPDDLITPESLRGEHCRFDFSSHDWVMTIDIDADSGGGQFELTDGSPVSPAGAIDRAYWQKEPYHGVLTLEFEPGTIVPFQFKMAFRTPAEGIFRGTAFTPNGLEIRGDFTVE